MHPVHYGEGWERLGQADGRVSALTGIQIGHRCFRITEYGIYSQADITLLVCR